MMNLTEVTRKELNSKGFAILKSTVPLETLNSIDKELEPWLRQIAWNDTLGYSLMGKDKWLYHLGICSPTLVRFALDEKILDFLASLFGEEPILAEFSLHSSTSDNYELPYHSDRHGGIGLYLFLTEMNESNGQLCVISGTQGNKQYFFIPEEEVRKKQSQVVPLTVSRGDVVFYNQDMWHKRAAGKAGRSVVKIIYHAASRVDGALDHLYRQSILAGLSERQLRCFGIGHPRFEREGYFRNTGRAFGIQDVKNALLYLKRLRFLDFSKLKMKAGTIIRK